VSGASVDPLAVERAGGVVVATLSRPERLNALSTDLISALDGLLDELERAPRRGPGAAAVVVIAGAGRSFCAGADISELHGLDGPVGFSGHVKRMADVFARLQALPIPSIAAVHGTALGGGFELALACDLRIAEESARFGVPEIKLGLLPAAGGTARLSRMVPPSVAKQLLLTGDPISAGTAHTLGLVSEVVPDGGALEAALMAARRIAALSAPALAAAKRLVDQGSKMPLEAAVVLERETVSVLFGTAERVEGIAAFLEKRSPSFR
jgi:enoyl-CoA hydratase